MGNQKRGHQKNKVIGNVVLEKYSENTLTTKTDERMGDKSTLLGEYDRKRKRRLMRGDEILARIQWAKLEEQIGWRKRIKWLQNIKHWTDMALEKIMIAAMNGKNGKGLYANANCKCNLMEGYCGYNKKLDIKRETFKESGNYRFGRHQAQALGFVNY